MSEERARNAADQTLAGLEPGWSQIRAWKQLVTHVEHHGLEPWLVDTLETTAKVIAGGLNVLGLHRVVITGSLTEFPECVLARLTAGIRQGALWARFGEVTCQSAVRRRASGLVAMGIDRLVLPADEENQQPLLALSGAPGARKMLAPVLK